MPKILQKLAFILEGTDTASLWGGSLSELTPKAGDQIPFTSFEKGMTVNSVEDNNILSTGFPDTPVQVTKSVDKSGGFNFFFSGLNKVLYWIFGFENPSIPVLVTTIIAPSTEPIAGAVYHDGASADLTFMRKEISGAGTFYIFQVASNYSIPVSQILEIHHCIF
jgi:hypothetical protein